jgi:tetratricopeptide (TPR) repeat protein
VWNLAAVGLVQRAYDQQSSVVVNAARRFPDEDRFHLAAAIARELVTWRVVRLPRDARNAGQASLRDLVKVFEPLLARSSVRAEVNLRLGQTYLRLRQPKVALEHLTRVEPLSKDPFLRYLSRYLSGRAREAMGDAVGAEAAHRGALAIVPGAQSASFALAALAFDRDARDEANAVIEAALSGPEPVEDPWRSYQAGDFRFWTGFVALLRRELQ